MMMMFSEATTQGSSTQSFQHVKQEIDRLFEQFKKARNQESERIALELRQLYLKNSGYYDEIFRNLLILIQSPDLNEKYNGLIGLESVSHVVQENQYMNVWNKFFTLIFNQFDLAVEERHLKKIADVFGRLLRVGGSRILNVLQNQIQSAIDWSFQKKFRENKKYAGLLVLKELLEEAPFVTYKVIINTENYRVNLWHLIKNKNILLREAALTFFDALLKQISLKIQDIPDTEYSAFYEDIVQSKKAKEEEVIVGNISALKILLSYAKQGQFNEGELKEMADFVLSKREASSPSIQRTVIETLPILAQFNSIVFTQHFFATTVSHLLSHINPKKQKAPTYEMTVAYYDCLSAICESVNSTVYDKLNETEKVLTFKNIELITREIRQDLQEMKAYIPSRISCLMNILKNFLSRYNDLIYDEDLLINNILFNGLYPQSIEFLKQIQTFDVGGSEISAEKKKQRRSEVSSMIQYRLLLSIITILSKQKNTFPQNLSPQKDNDKMFQQKLNQNSERNLQSDDERAIANAIQTLSTFGFSNYDNELANFVKDNVLDYLDNKNKMIRKAAAKAGCLLYVKKERGQLISKNIMYEILEKFMSVAISDPEDEIRQTMLKSLNENFDQYLNEPNYLKKLFLCVNDSNIHVQQLVLTILCRLSKFNPADILPFLKMTLFEFLSQLTFNDVENERSMINLLSSLTCLMKNGPSLVRPHSQSIANILLNFLKDPNITNNMIPELLKAFSQLSSLGDFNILLYMDEIFPIFLQAMQDKSSTAKREAAVKSLVEILKNTGFVVLPYYKYPSFLEIILSLMKNETNVEMRLQCMRLIGCLGAIDNFYYKKVSDKVRNTYAISPLQDNRTIINQIIRNSLKQKFKYFKNFTTAKQQESSTSLTKQLNQYYQDILLLENFKQKRMFLNLANMQASQAYEEDQRAGRNSQLAVQTPGFSLQQEKKDSRDQNMIEKLFIKQEIDEEIKTLLQAPTVIALNDEYYCARVTLKALLKVLCDQSLNEHHNLTVDTLIFIIDLLKTRTNNFLDLLIPVLIKILSLDLLRDRQKVLKLIQNIIRNCGRQYDVEFIDPVVTVFLEYGKEPSNQKICFGILESLVEYQKINLRHKIEPIIRLTNNAIYKIQIETDIVLTVIQIYSKLADLLDPTLHLIIPFLCSLMNRDLPLFKIQIKIEIAKLFSILAHRCQSTVQFLSLIINSILFNLCNQTNQRIQSNLQLTAESNSQNGNGESFLTTCLMNTVVVFIYKYKNQFLVYLTQLNSLVKMHNIQHKAYQKCLEIFLNNGNLDDISSQIETEFDNIVGFHFSNGSEFGSIIPEPQTMLIQKIDSEKFKHVFDTHSNKSKEDWNQWMRKTAVELLKESPNVILKPCNQLAEVYEELQAELYNISFASVWSQLKYKEKDFIINQFSKAIQPPTQRESELSSYNVPINILQTILNLAEFMQHDNEGLQIDNSTLASLAERCLAYAKALHYRENEFETDNESTTESLITLYMNLGQREAAKGLSEKSSRVLRRDVKMSWLERLHQWDRALDDYRVCQLEDPTKNVFLPKMRCLNALSEWELLIDSTNAEINPNNQKQVMHLAANAAMNLGKWNLLESFVDRLSEDNCQEKSFWQAAVAISKGNLDESKGLITNSIMKLDSQVSGLLLESYGRAYESILRLQQLFEMQEIVEIKEIEVKRKNAQNIGDGIGRSALDAQLQLKSEQLNRIWADRLAGNPKDIDTWQRILSVRSLHLSKKNDLPTWLKFCRLALKKNQMMICKKTLESLSQEYKRSEEQLPTVLKLASLECSYSQNNSNEKDICRAMEELLENDQSLDVKLRAKTFLKMGNWIRDKTEELNSESLQMIESLYSKSMEFKPDYYKTWHHFGLLNFEAINLPSNQDRVPDQKHAYILNSLKGFMRSITLGTTSEHKSPYLLQDSLRLLSVLFNYGEIEEIHDKFLQNFRLIDNRAWIEVIPQIIARISTSKKPVRGLLQQLLIHIATQHPQALIYPLTVASKSKEPIRQQAAKEIMSNISKHSPTLVTQAELISSELNRTAILLKEEWHEGIKEAGVLYRGTKGNDHHHLTKILFDLHGLMQVQPESLSEISFHQKFGTDLSEAEAWLNRYIQTENPICLCQAFDIYYRVYLELSSQLDKLEFVYLENVSPKLLGTKNSEISIPGLYKPARPIIKIACFQPRLEVLFSKMHPRKLFVYGSDSKEYHFLLKGREDMRQDERVMQLFGLINRLLHNNPETEKKDLNITRYSIIPLSINTGLLGWVHNCDTLQVLIKEYRKALNIRDNPEHFLMENFCSNYSLLPLPNKVEIFRHIIGETKGEDLKKVLWLKSQNSEIWLERRTNYTRSLATMSIAGYILGLGDRHPSNIMLQRSTGKIVHIDFGDCFEVAMRRDNFPERVPFRLTRMLVNAMEACQIEGNYRSTCELVMKVIRENKESLIAVLEAFVHDPLFNWRLESISGEEANGNKNPEEHLIDGNEGKANGNQKMKQQNQNSFIPKRSSRMQSLLAENGGNFAGSIIQQGTSLAFKRAIKQSTKKKIVDPNDKDRASSPGNRDKEKYYANKDDEKERKKEKSNNRALEVMDRIKKKLHGKDFVENHSLKYVEQVKKLIDQATSHENICQAYIGWCPFW